MDRKKVIYSILKEIEKGNADELHHTKYDMTLEEWGLIAELIRDENLAKNVNVSRGGMGNKVVMVFYKHSTITMQGLDFLEQNSMLSKTYKGLKEIRDWLPL